MAAGDGRAVGAGDVLLAGNRSDSRSGVPRAAGARQARPARADPHLERALRDRRGAADDRDGARGGRLVRPGADRDSRQRRQPRGDRQGAARALSRAIVPRAAAELREKYFVAANGALRRRCRSCSSGSRRGAWSICWTAQTVAPLRGLPGDLLPQRVHLFFAAERQDRSSTRSPTACRRRGICWSARRNRC